MASWSELVASAPELGRYGAERIVQPRLVLVGTLRANGSPRISPVEALVVDGDLMLGMMWQSRKALDLLRDPRCTVSSITKRDDASDGDFKIYGAAVPVDDSARRERFREACRAAMDWAPEEPEYHLFAVDITSVGFFRGGTNREALAWDPSGGLRVLAVPPPPG